MRVSPPRHLPELALRRVLVLPLTLLIGAGVALPLLPLVTSAQADPASSAVLSATVVLRTGASAEGLAQTADLPRVARLDRLRDTLPTAADQAAAPVDVRALGLTVDSSTPWSLVVSGPSAAIGELGSLPEVSTVLTAAGPRPVAAAGQTPLAGPQFRAAYQASSAAPAAGTQPIIATIQLSGWDSTELSGYAANSKELTGQSGLPAPVYTAIGVGGASTTSGGVAGGSAEVALDQESIYDTDPYAHQRAYFTAPDAAGMVAALDRVAADAVAMPGLVALSISWTFCEGAFLDNQTDEAQLAAMHQAMATVVAAGVTVFAASGDSGGDCNDTPTKGVNYPASDPLVVAVGGTSLTLSPTVETGWPGSGGGISTEKPQTWQAAVAPGATGREVPDIAADADVDTGFYAWHDDGDGSGVGPQLMGGTSLASPVSAAGYVAELGARGAIDGGLGDLHGALYSAPSSDFRDITQGSSGLYAAAAGYDMLTGLGAPLWGPLVSRILAQPAISVPATSTSLVVPVTVSAPGGQTFLAWVTGSGNPPSSCGTSGGKPATAQPVTVPFDGGYRIWAVGYVGFQHCFIVSTTTVVSSGHPAPPTTRPPAPTTSASPAPTTSAPTTSAPTTSAPTTSAPTTVAPIPGIPTTEPTPTSPPAAIAPPPVELPQTDVTPPTVTLSARVSSLGTAAIAFSWHSSDGTGSGVASVAATVSCNGKPVWSKATGPASYTVTVTGLAGRSCRLSVLAADRAGNYAGFASNTVRLPYDDRSFRFGSGWTRSSSRHAFGGSYVSSAKPGATASIRLTGRTFSLLTSTGPAEGVLSVYVDGVHVRDVSLYSKAVHTSVLVVLDRFRSSGLHRITLLVKGAHAVHATGVIVPVDGLSVA